jgi:hypothetical protein
MNDQSNSLISLEAEVTPDAKEQLDGLAKWAIYSAIIGFVSAGLAIITFVVTLNKVSSNVAASNLFQTFLVTGISLLLNITLFGAGLYLKKGISTADQGFFNMGLKKLNNYFKILGILMIIVLSIVLLAIFFGGMISLFN